MNINKKIDRYLDESKVDDVMDSNFVRKMTGRLSKADSALRYSEIIIQRILDYIDEYNKGKINEEIFTGFMVQERKELITAVKLIKTGRKK